MRRDQPDQPAQESVQTLLADANPVPESAVANSYRDPVGRAAYAAIVRTDPDAATGAMTVPDRSQAARPRRGLVIGTAAVAASVAAGLVIGGVPSRLLGSTGTTKPPVGISRPAVPTKTTTWPARSAKAAKGTAPMLHYVLTGTVQPGSVTGLPLARPVLLKLARAAARRAPLAQPPGARVSLVETNEWFLDTAIDTNGTSSVIIPEVDKTWYAPNGMVRVLSRRGHPEVVAVGSPSSLRAAEYGRPVSDSRYRAEYSDPAVARLSLDPAVLIRQLMHADPGGSPESYRLFDIIRILHHQVVSPRLDAAMWRVLATRPDVRYLGRVTDRAGRTGQAVTFTERGGEREVLIISPSGQLLGSEDLILHGAKGLNITVYPAVAGYTTFLGQHWVKTSDGR